MWELGGGVAPPTRTWRRKGMDPVEVAMLSQIPLRGAACLLPMCESAPSWCLPSRLQNLKHVSYFCRYAIKNNCVLLNGWYFLVFFFLLVNLVFTNISTKCTLTFFRLFSVKKQLHCTLLSIISPFNSCFNNC